jgi:hypothetical protein
MAEQLAILVLELSYFIILSVILLQCSAIFTTLLIHFMFCYNKLSHFLILSAIFYCYSNSPIFPFLLCSSIFATVFRHFATLLNIFIVLGHFMILSAIFHCYITQPFLTATILDNFPVLQCSDICDPVSHFRVARKGSGSREGMRLDCMRACGSISYAHRTEP